MAIAFNHTIVQAEDPLSAARLWSELFGLAEPTAFGHFWVVRSDNGVSFDFMAGEASEPQHYAFLVSETEFDAILGRIQERGMDYWADPYGRHHMQINHDHGGRGVYFKDLSGNYLEAITQPYGADKR